MKNLSSPHILLSTFLLAANFAACGDDSGGDEGGLVTLSDTSTDVGTTITATTTDATTTATDVTTDATTDPTTSTDDGPDCTPGTLACECDAGCCGSGLTCHPNGICIEQECVPGTLGCECPDGTCGSGTSCDSPLSCVDGTCLDLSDPTCLDPYEMCMDNDLGSLGACCPGSTCIGNATTNVWGCALPCTLHSECVTDCCVTADLGGGATQTMCSPGVQYCVDNGKCINSCFDADDGFCDDGGPGSDYSICELGTDCADCGPRYP